MSRQCDWMYCREIFSLVVFLFISRNVFISSSYRAFSLKPAQRQPQSQEGHKMQVFKPGKQAMLFILKPGFVPVLFFKCWTLELSRWLKEGSGGHYKEPKAETWEQHHASNFFICPSKTRFWIVLLNFYQRFLMHEAQMDQAWKK